jgi:hypothetical protein
MGRTIIVGDVHGCRRELEQLLERIGFEAGDRLIFVGDLIARGPDSLGVLDVARRTGAVVVRGNHEQKLIAWREARRAQLRGERVAPVQLGPTHLPIARAMREVDWTLLETSPLMVDLPEHGARIVHAGVLPGVPIEETKPTTLLHIRTVRKDGRASANDGPVLWGARYMGPPHVIFGHNAAPGLQLHKWATGLDTGCVYGRQLTAMVLAERQKIPMAFRARRELLVSESAARAYAEPARRLRGVA